MIFVTGDCHADFHKFNTKQFPQQKEMTKDDYVIVCGDFGGIWNNSESERYWLDWMERKSFTLLFVDGNHENFDMLATFPVVDFHGGKVHQIRSNIFHLMRGQCYDLQGKTFFCFGGASSHDIEDGILDPFGFEDKSKFVETYCNWTKQGKQFRIKGISWWQQELPCEEEMYEATWNLAMENFKVDFVITHCLPQSMASALSFTQSDKLTLFFEQLLAKGLTFKRWYCGHYHIDKSLLNYVVLYNNIEQIA